MNDLNLVVILMGRMGVGGCVGGAAHAFYDEKSQKRHFNVRIYACKILFDRKFSGDLKNKT